MKAAHDELIAAAHRAQADALEIEAQAKRRLADEYDAAQARGEVASNGQRGKVVPDENSLATISDLGLTRKAIHEARQLPDLWMRPNLTLPYGDEVKRRMADMSEAAADALRAAQHALKSFDEDLERASGPEARSIAAQERLAREATLIRGELSAMRIMLAEALEKLR